MQSLILSEGKDVRVRLHVPKHIKTIYKTKIIKVPEHHHYIHHEKKEEAFEPLKIPQYHHFFHDENEKIKQKHRYNHRHDESDEDDNKKLTLEEVRLILENAGRLARYNNYKRYHIDPNKK
ncbi:uncharacterized protein LOC108732738 [Agrilus planipennis]|uniref:Uncharacterized protein LOC108732738 n=1 Tax=Agrilus planipennis TaxID=224129 RepID=A0A7F5R2L5_AGRPL|nr:uncharacterized protein LOC108732738 [Agrilus planipennis]